METSFSSGLSAESEWLASSPAEPRNWIMANCNQVCLQENLVNGQGQFCWEDITNSSVIFPHLFHDGSEFHYGHPSIWCYTGVVGKTQLPYAKKLCDHTDIDDQMHWETKSKPYQNGIFMANEWPETELALANHELISMLNCSTHIYYKVQIAVEERRKWVINLIWQ